MLGNCDNNNNNNIIISSTTNQWPQVLSLSLSHCLNYYTSKDDPIFCFIAFVQEYPNCVVNFYPKSTPSPTLSFSLFPQNQIILDDHKTLMASSSANKVMAADKPNPADHHPHPPLKCPRCDSSNTKFCYYNNYSLSQPRHFCKACKRYWTRGGTLRNVPVGGGCRKNKRPKRHSTSSSSATTSSTSHPQIDLPPPPSNHVQNPLFYGLNNPNPLELNFPFSTFRVSTQINSLGLGFSPEPPTNGFKPIQNNTIFFGSSSTMASLIQYDDPGIMDKQMKAEGENRMVWNPNPNPNQNPNLNTNPIDQINSSDPSSSLVWNTSSLGAWFDPSTIGSSVPSLI